MKPLPVLLSLALALGACAQVPRLPAGARAVGDRAYVENGHPQQKLDLFLPEKTSAPLPLLIWIHGGAWQAGSKAQCPALRFLERGYAVASLEYRFSQDAIFPAQLEDCKAAIRWLRAHAKEYSLDPRRFGVWGSSAGGHLVALLGTTGDVKEFDVGANLDQSSRVQAVCDWFGPTDFAVFVTTPGYESHATRSSPESKLIGGLVLEDKDKAARANPITYLSQDDPPFLIMHGDKDPTVPINQSQLLFDALKQAGVSARFHTIPGAGHGGPGFTGRNIAEMVNAFFDERLQGNNAKMEALATESIADAAGSAGDNKVPVSDGIVLPRRPVADAIADAMQFLKKADGGYVPGRIDRELAGYFTSAHVNPDGSRSERRLSFPARQHAYFIRTFLMYHAYTGEQEWLLRARDLGDWDLAHSTPPHAAYPNLPYSTFSDGKAGGSKDLDSIEPDKTAFFGSACIALYEATAESKYLNAARAIAETLARHQRPDGSWPFRVVPENGDVRQDFGGAPVFFVEFFEKLAHYDDTPANRRAHDQALQLMLARNIQKNLWGTYHEDVGPKPEDYPSAEPICFTADYLFRQAGTHPKYVAMGRGIIQGMEARLVYTNGHAAAPAPAVSEQAGFQHLMPGHTARYCRALADLYAVTGAEQVKRRALSGINALTYMQTPPGLFRTFFYSVNPQTASKQRPDWYSQHLYTVCHVLEAMASLPELAPSGHDHLLGSDVFLREILYSPGRVSFETLAPSRTVLKLSFTPQAVYAGARDLPSLKELPADDSLGWSFNPASSLLTIRHPSGPVEVVSGLVPGGRQAGDADESRPPRRPATP